MSSPSTPNQGILGRMFGSISRLVSTPTTVSNENQAPYSNVGLYIRDEPNVATPRANSQGRPVLVPRKPRRWGGESPPRTPIQANGRSALTPRQPRAAPQSEPRNNQRSNSPPYAPGHWPKTQEQVKIQEQPVPTQSTATKPRRVPASERRRKSKWRQQTPEARLEEAQENWVKYQELMRPAPSPEQYRPFHSVKNFEGEMPPSAMKMKRAASPIKFTPSKKVKFNEQHQLKLISPTQLHERTLTDPSPRKRQRASSDYDGGEFDDDRPAKRQNLFGQPVVSNPTDAFQVPATIQSVDSANSMTESDISSTTKANTMRNRFISPPGPSASLASSSLTPQDADFEPSREHPAPGMFCVPDYSDDDLSLLSNVDTTVLSNQSPPPSVASHIATPGLQPPAPPLFNGQATNMFKGPSYSTTATDPASSARDPTPTPAPKIAATPPSPAAIQPNMSSNTPKLNVSSNTPRVSISSNTPPKPRLPFPTTPNLFASASKPASTPTTTTISTSKRSSSTTTKTMTLTKPSSSFPPSRPHVASAAVLALLNARTELAATEDAAFAQQAWEYGLGRFVQEKKLATEQGRQIVYLL